MIRAKIFLVNRKREKLNHKKRNRIIRKEMEIAVQEPWFSFIKTGEKVVEGRKNKAPWNTLCPGDVIIFKINSSKVICLVTDVHVYDKGLVNKLNPLRRYLKTETLKRVLPGIKTLEEGEKIYLQWSSMEEILEYGFLGIQFSIVT